MTNSAQNVIKPKRKIVKREPNFLFRFIVTLLLLLVLFGVSITISLYSKEVNAPLPTSFEECQIAKGSKVEESYPPICVTKAGQEFVKKLDPSENPLPTQGPQKTDKICGGIAGLPCPDGYTCVLDGNYPDAAGNCQLK